MWFGVGWKLSGESEMTLVKVERAVDGAQLVKSASVRGRTLIQVWRGGTTVNVYRPAQETGKWEEVDVWTMMDDEGKPVEREKIEVHMEMRWTTYEEEL